MRTSAKTPLSRHCAGKSQGANRFPKLRTRGCRRRRVLWCHDPELNSGTRHSGRLCIPARQGSLSPVPGLRVRLASASALHFRAKSRLSSLVLGWATIAPPACPPGLEGVRRVPPVYPGSSRLPQGSRAARTRETMGAYCVRAAARQGQARTAALRGPAAPPGGRARHGSPGDGGARDPSPPASPGRGRAARSEHGKNSPPREETKPTTLQGRTGPVWCWFGGEVSRSSGWPRRSLSSGLISNAPASAALSDGMTAVSPSPCPAARAEIFFLSFSFVRFCISRRGFPG